jgi:prevent-host-death family protein
MDHDGHMPTAPVADLKSRLSYYLRQVKQGQDVVITERGLPVARLVPLSPEEWRKSGREELIAAGLLRPGRGVRKALLKPPPGEGVDGVLEALLDERASGR